MIKKTLFFLLIAFITKSFSQEKKINFQFSLGPTVSIPSKGEQKIDFREYPGLLNSEVLERIPKINVGGYILPSLQYLLNRKISFDFGLGFYFDRSSFQEISTSFNFHNEAELPFVSDVFKNVGQIVTPFNINFHLGKNKSYSLGVGGFASFLLFANEITKHQSNELVDLLLVRPVRNNSFQDKEDDYASTRFGAFLQLKKNIVFSSKTSGFLILRANQYLTPSDKNKESFISNYIKNEELPLTINLGVGIDL